MTQTRAITSVVARTARRIGLGDTATRVGPWELVSLAAEGVLARVYRARPAGAPRDVAASYALKLLRPEWDNDGRAVELIRREAIVGRQVANPHVVPVLAAGTGEPPYYVVTPWLEGATLATRLARGDRFDLPVALWIARQVAEALEGITAAGWMHGDVKPANILISPSGHATLIDLGFARHRDEGGSIIERYVAGTCSYAAPELLTSALRPDIRSDIYSLGVVLYEMLAGRLPFEAQTLAELVEQHQRARPAKLRVLAPEVPRAVARFVHQMLAKEPLRRPQTPREAVMRLAAMEIETFSERAL
ncbi:MAG: serine/threonine protein kinase [Thermoguttaceae bacterium]|nr:serine/threonine protein kinase [Thermoguttaceae bacterium]